MGPVVFYVGFYFLVSALQLASSKVENYNGWKNSPNVQYHIQTDEGEERYFKYQTKSGQYRKEKRLEDGTVVGTYGWVDPNGYLRLRDYIADNQGYRILKTKMIYVGGGTEPATFTLQSSLQPPPQSHRFSGLPQNGYLPPRYQVSGISTQAPVVHETPSIPSTSLLSPYYSPVSGTSTPAPIVRVNPSTPATSLLGPYYSSPDVQVSPDSGHSSTTPYPTPASSSPSVAIFVDPTPAPVAVYSSTPKPVAVNYVPSSDSSGGGHPSSNPLVIVRAPTDSPPRLPPVAGKFAFVDAGNNNFITETNKNKLFYRSEGLHAVDDGSSYVGYVGGYDDNTYGEYDGISTVQNGFRYYLPRHYHEEQSSPDGRDRTGSFGYVDPFGIRRVIYYNTSPGKGFVHKKNNRYVGFHSTPYDPRPNF